MAISPAQYQWEKEHPTGTTKAMALGTVIHLALLQPDLFWSTYRTVNCNRGTKKFDECVAEDDSRVVVTTEEFDIIDNLTDRYRANKFCNQITQGSFVEHGVYWTDADTGLECKARPDLFNDLVLVDLKKTRHTSNRQWWWDFRGMFYHAQFAFYHDALEHVDGRKRTCVVIKAETIPCYDVVFYALPDAAIDAGREHYKRLLCELRDCIEAGLWPGKCEGLSDVDFDKW
jgi:hypothetical protein